MQASRKIWEKSWIRAASTKASEIPANALSEIVWSRLLPWEDRGVIS